MTADQEDLLIAYFKSYTRKMEKNLAHTARTLKLTGKGDMGEILGNAAEHILDFFQLVKLTPRGYRFMVSESIIKALDIPLPAEVKKLIYGGSEGVWSKLSSRITSDLRGDVARRMGFSPNVVQVLTP